ncbi:hypothetical protein [Phormidium tenue]|uniref:hypothetical protein n=1 Tax=Phormidium tenue TaxID=126344 RepID=UPI0009FFA415|nr:hypothetical protein [Phormidium tenue]MBD2231999.1 hypothetical protein [Phormidium tenue FACHB-1052]
MTRSITRLAALLLCATVLILAIALGQRANPINLNEVVAQSAPGDTVRVPSGIYELSSPLVLKPGMTLMGDGVERTVIKAASSWAPGLDGLPNQDNPDAYLLKLIDINDIKVADLTLTGPTLHGAIYADDADQLELSHLQINNFAWSGVRTLGLSGLKVHDCQFIDAGGEVKWTSGALFMTHTEKSEFWNNLIQKSEGLDRNFYGFKGRGGSNLRFHHNDVQVNFSLEYPFENDANIEIDHNRFDGVISIPKFGGGPVLNERRSFHIHHNWLKRSYTLEWTRNSAEIDHNLFDFEVSEDGGNLISSFGNEPAPGPTDFHDNLINNPGRGIFWANGPYDHFRFYNNHVKSNGQNRWEGFFGFHPATDFATIVIKDNIFDNTAANPRPLMRNDVSYRATVQNNQLINVSDADRFTDNATERLRGPKQPLQFTVGVNGTYQIDAWTARRA